MNVLAIDSATEILGIALARLPWTPENTPHRHSPDAAPAFAERRFDGGLHHAQTAAGEVSAILEESSIQASEVDLIAVTSGPGSFTGLRIGVSLAKGLSAGTGAPVVGVPTLDRFSWHLWWTESLIVPVIDARKKRFYAAVYRGATRLSEDLDVSGSVLIHEIDAARREADRSGAGAHGGAVVLTGPHADRFSELFGQGHEVVVDPAARSSSLLGMIDLAVRKHEARDLLGEDEGPQYVRESDAKLPSRGTD